MTGQKVTQEVLLTFPVINENKSIEVTIDEDVLINFYRSKAAAALKEATVFGDNGEMAKAQKIINSSINEIKKSKVASHKTSVKILKDLDKAVHSFHSIQDYQHGGKAAVKSKVSAHNSKRGCYKNQMQKTLLKMSKK